LRFAKFRPGVRGILTPRRTPRKGLFVSADMGAEIIKTENVTKRFGELVAVDRVNYVLRENEVAGIVGSNGAGKTTFFNLITGYYMPDEGTIWYKGKDITRVSPQKRVDMGMMRTFQLTATFDNLTVIDNLVLSFFRAHKSASLFPLFLATCKQYRGEERIAESLETFDLQNESHRQVKHLSLGEKRRLEIAMAILAEPKVLLLDEPLAGLAESEIKEVLGVLGKRIGKQTLLIVEHKISQVEDFLERLTVMHEGRIIADGACEECLRDPEVRRSYWQIETPADGTDDPRPHGVHGDE
jgi:ABC-type branched-subunit amino acid transport system ATPase component